MRIYISSACIPERDLAKNLHHFKSLGYNYIELTGGINFEHKIFEQIEYLEKSFSTNIQLHNYSPPPERSFVLNLASLNEETFNRSFNHVKSSIEFTKKARFRKYAVHAGFYIPIQSNELGKLIKKRELYNKGECKDKFVNAINELYKIESEALYIENNVVSGANFQEYGENPFMLTCAEEYFELKERIPRLKLLLDLAHLKVSCNSLGLSFKDEVFKLINETDYIHISDNDGLADTNQGLVEGSEMYDILRTLDLSAKTITLEVYSGIDDLERTYQLISKLK